MAAPAERRRPLSCLGQPGQQGGLPPLPLEASQIEEHRRLFQAYEAVMKQIYGSTYNVQEYLKAPESVEVIRQRLELTNQEKWRLIGGFDALLRVAKKHLSADASQLLEQTMENNKTSGLKWKVAELEKLCVPPPEGNQE